MQHIERASERGGTGITLTQATSPYHRRYIAADTQQKGSNHRCHLVARDTRHTQPEAYAIAPISINERTAEALMEHTRAGRTYTFGLLVELIELLIKQPVESARVQQLAQLVLCWRCRH